MVLAVDCVNSRGDHFATTAEQSQHIDQLLVVPAQAGANNLGILTVFPQQFYGLSKGDRLVGGNSSALLRLGQACAAVRRVGVNAGSIESSSGSARVTPAPRKNVRRGI